MVREINEAKKLFIQFLNVDCSLIQNESNIPFESDYNHAIPFESDYNWSMALVDKIESLGFEVFINGLYCRITDSGLTDLEIESGEVTTKKMAILDACEQFIDYYNNIKK